MKRRQGFSTIVAALVVLAGACSTDSSGNAQGSGGAVPGTGGASDTGGANASGGENGSGGDVACLFFRHVTDEPVILLINRRKLI